MPRTTLRPLASEIERIDDVLKEADLTPQARRQLNLVLAWAKGGKDGLLSAVAAKKACSRETVRTAVKLYQMKGLDAFLAPIAKKRGRRPLPPELQAAVASLLRQSFEEGQPITYAKVAEALGLSVVSVARIASRLRLDPEHRRGPVAGRGQPS